MNDMKNEEKNYYICGVSFYIKYSKFLRILLFFSEEYLKNYIVLFHYHNKILLIISTYR